MAPSNADTPLVSVLKEEVGDDLRSVIRYEEDDYEIAFIREDVDTIYEPAEINEVVDDLRLQGWGQSYLDGVFNAGNLRCSAFAFEDAMVLLFGQDGFEGALVTYEMGAGVDLDTFIDICETHL